jgi:sialate O-acetylesterase
MPFCIISLCTAGEPQTLENFLKPMNDAGSYIREAQYKTFRDLRDAGDEQIGFISSFDLRKSFYHPQIKVPAGERAAKWALASVYNATQHWLPPSIDKMEIADGAIRLKMSTDITTKDDSDGRMLGFAIAGKDRRFYPAETHWYSDGSVNDRKKKIEDHSVLVLTSPFVPEPVAYRYAWARNPLGNLVNSLQVPLPAQRSDNWVLEETPEKITPPANMPEDGARRYLSSQRARLLELGDTERRIQEAEATIAKLKPAFENARAQLREAGKKAER